MRACIYLEIDERSSSFLLRKTISEPRTGIKPTTFRSPVGRRNCIDHYQYIMASAWVAHICQSCTIARHLSLSSSTVKASHRSPEDSGFDPFQGLRNRFLAMELTIVHLPQDFLEPISIKTRYTPGLLNYIFRLLALAHACCLLGVFIIGFSKYRNLGKIDRTIVGRMVICIILLIVHKAKER